MKFKLPVAPTWAGIAALSLIGAGYLASPIYPSCTVFMIRHESGTVTSKNLDWPIGLGAVLFNSAGLRKTALAYPPDEPASWVSRFSSVTLNQFGREFPLGGMNDVGLVVEEISYWPARYPNQDARPVVNELQWIQFQLDNHATVREVLENESAVRIAPLLFGLHYFVTDSSGDAAIIEYLNGTPLVYTAGDLPVAALTNDSYENLLRQLRHHAGFGGEREPSAGPEAPEQFVRAATRISRFESTALRSPVDSAFALLDDTAQHDTQWSIVYDPAKLTIHLRTRANRSVRSFRIPDRRGSCIQEAAGFRMENPGISWDGWTVEDNESLLNEVFQALRSTQVELPAADRKVDLARYPETLTCDSTKSR